MKLKLWLSFIIIIFICFCLLSGWPVIWQNPRIPPKIKEVRAEALYDTVSESHTSTTGSVSVASFSWTHTPIGTARGVVVFVNTIGSADLSTSVTYGGVAMSRVANSTASDTATEPGTVTAWFLGSSIPTGSQTVVVSRTNSATVVYANCITIVSLVDIDTTIVGSPVLLKENGTYTEQSIDTGFSTALRLAAGYYGGSGVLPAGANSISTGASGQIDYGAYTFTTVVEAAKGSSSRNIGFSGGTDDRAAVHLAIGGVYSIIIDSADTIDYGLIPFGESENTVDLNETRTVTNTSSVPAKFSIKSSNAIGGTQWNLGENSGVNTFVHEYSINEGQDWIKFESDTGYKTLGSSVEDDGTVDFDLKITIPTSSDFEQKTITVTVQVSELDP